MIKLMEESKDSQSIIADKKPLNNSVVDVGIKPKKKNRKILRFFIIIILITVAILVLGFILFKYINHNPNIPGTEIGTKIEPTGIINNTAQVLKPTIINDTESLAKIKEIKELKNKTGLLRYLTVHNQSWSENYIPKYEIVDYDLAKNASSSSIISTNFVYSRNFSPNGKYLGYSLLTTSDKVNVNEFYLYNLDNNHIIYSGQNMGGPYTESMRWVNDNYASVSNIGKNVLISLTGESVLIKLPHKGAGNHIFFSNDMKYLIYEFAANLFVLQDYYPSVGIVRINPDSAQIIKIFNENDQEMTSFYCWKEHNAIIIQNKYSSPLDENGYSTSSVVENYLVSNYDADTGEITKICDSDKCEKNIKSLCDEKQNQYDSNYEELLSKEKKQASDLVTKSINGIINMVEPIDYYEISVNKKENLIAFAYPFSTRQSSKDMYIFVLDLTTYELYRVGQGQAPRWIQN